MHLPCLHISTASECSERFWAATGRIHTKYSPFGRTADMALNQIKRSIRTISIAILLFTIIDFAHLGDIVENMNGRTASLCRTYFRMNVAHAKGDWVG